MCARPRTAADPRGDRARALGNLTYGDWSERACTLRLLQGRLARRSTPIAEWCSWYRKRAGAPAQAAPATLSASARRCTRTTTGRRRAAAGAWDRAEPGRAAGVPGRANSGLCNAGVAAPGARRRRRCKQQLLAELVRWARRRRWCRAQIGKDCRGAGRSALAQGDLASALHWARNAASTVADAGHYPREAELLTLARVWIAQAQHDPAGPQVRQALDLLAQLQAGAEQHDRRDSLLTITILRALALGGTATQTGRRGHDRARAHGGRRRRLCVAVLSTKASDSHAAAGGAVNYRRARLCCAAAGCSRCTWWRWSRGVTRCRTTSCLG